MLFEQYVAALPPNPPNPELLLGLATRAQKLEAPVQLCVVRLRTLGVDVPPPAPASPPHDRTDIIYDGHCCIDFGEIM